MRMISRLQTSVGWGTSLIAGSTTAALLMASAWPSHASWAPKPEPKFWSEVRLQMTDQEKVPQADWTFMEAMQSPKIDAVEYLRELRRDGQTVTFQALLLMRKGDGNPWGSRQLSMRAQCLEGLLERQNLQGGWSVYPGRQGTASKVNWICAQAPNP